MNATVLYVDDEAVNLFIFKSYFGSKYNVITAESGEEGLEKFEEYEDNIQIVFSDMRMPGMDGVEFINKAKSEFPQVEYFLLTAFPSDETVHDALEKGLIKHTFSKPFAPREIEEAIAKSVENHN
ncbi:MAG TPA: response regulator [Cyclobacteriaceae bacterium]